ncbi:DUF4435 domain-containing protein [Roseomonas sp. ACRSG]|nr:DUF4435 domain-containing protein [Roseomonas sp. ACRSG]
MEADIDFVEFLNEQAKSDVAALHQFMLLYSSEAKSLHLFFEGEEDPPYYLPAVRRIFSGLDPKIYICGGKGNVISARDEIKTRQYDTECCLFFIDRDYDDYLGSQPNIDEITYATEHYSIENYISGDEAVFIVLNDIIGMTQSDPEYAKITSFVRSSRHSFLSKMRAFTAWCLASKHMKERPNLNNANFKNIFTLTDEGRFAHKPRAFRSFRKQLLKDDSKVRKGEMLNWRRVFVNDRPEVWLRGKYALWLFEVSLTKALRDAAARRRSAGLRPFRIPQGLSGSGLFDLLGGRLPYPDSLLEFLGHHKSLLDRGSNL